MRLEILDKHVLMPKLQKLITIFDKFKIKYISIHCGSVKENLVS